MLKIEENILLNNYTTFKVGGPAKYFVFVKNEIELREALEFAKNKRLPFFVLGNGSNLLVFDLGFSGLIIKIEIKGRKIKSENSDSAIVSFGAGETFDDLINFAIKNGLSGIENLWNIPGTVGASAVQNIGAYGVEAKDFIESVEGIDSKTNKKFLLLKRDCDFKYRSSIFKRNKNLVITKVNFRLNKKFVPNLTYGSLKESLKDKIKVDVLKVKKTVEKIRKEKLPDWHKIGTAGSFFKNPTISEEKYKKLFKKYPELPKFVMGSGFVKIPLGYVIDKICGLKGFKKGNVGLYEKQALVIVNLGKATAKEIDSFAKFVEKKVFEKIGIRIEREVELLN